jgi:cobalamin biosynthesis protein CobT
MVSDGSAADGATSEANGSDYLTDHLARVVEATGSTSAIELVAVDVTDRSGSPYPRTARLDTDAEPDRVLVQTFVDAISNEGRVIPWVPRARRDPVRG